MRHGHRTEGSGHAPVHAACMKKGTIELCGADRWAEEWARERQVPYLGMPARWTAEGEWSRPPAQRAHGGPPWRRRRPGLPVDMRELTICAGRLTRLA